jgi:hypothetical protein
MTEAIFRARTKTAAMREGAALVHMAKCKLDTDDQRAEDRSGKALNPLIEKDMTSCARSLSFPRRARLSRSRHRCDTLVEELGENRGASVESRIR